MERVVLAEAAGDAVTSSRKASVLAGIETAMATRALVERCDSGSLGARRSTLPGLERVRLPQILVAFDEAAHIGLADFEKRTVFTQELAVERADVDIERLIWSSVNTSRAIALGTPAWASMQTLPIAGMSQHRMPPIDMGTPGSRAGLAARSGSRGPSIRIIAHGAQPLAAAAAAQLRRAEFAIEEHGEAWCDKAAIHLHIGPHDLDSEEPRIVDSWASGRLVIQMRGTSERASRSDPLLVDHERNGIVCKTAVDVVAACREVGEDESFWRQLVKAGHKTVAPLLAGWGEIVGAILA